MFKTGDPIHFNSKEVGTVNGYYEAKFFGDLHSFTALSGEKCAGEISKMGSIWGMHEGHDPKGKNYWNPKFKNGVK